MGRGEREMETSFWEMLPPASEGVRGPMALPMLSWPLKQESPPPPRLDAPLQIAVISQGCRAMQILPFLEEVRLRPSMQRPLSPRRTAEAGGGAGSLGAMPGPQGPRPICMRIPIVSSLKEMGTGRVLFSGHPADPPSVASEWRMLASKAGCLALEESHRPAGLGQLERGGLLGCPVCEPELGGGPAWVLWSLRRPWTPA